MSTIGDISYRTKWLVSKRYVQVSIVIAVVTLGIALPLFKSAFGLTDVGNAGVFEMDGNNITKESSTPLPTDWAALFNSDGTSRALPPGGLDSGFVNDAPTPDMTVFNTGSKDILNLPNSGWTCTSSPVLAKDKILDAYSFAAIAPTGSPRAGHLLVYAAMERASNLGSEDLGIWLFQDNSVNCSSPKGTAQFTGAHQVGDILLTAQYSTAGVVQILNAYEWVGTGGDVSGTLQTITGATGTDCQTASNTANFCARSNSVAFDGIPWPVQAAAKCPTGQLCPGDFFEVGIDLSGIFGVGNEPCVNRFLFDTRSSPSVTADLHDFAVGSLKTCPKASITTSVSPTPIALGSSATDTATVNLTRASFTVLGSVTFNAYASLSDCNAGTNSKFTSTKPIGPASPPASVTSAAFTPTAPGTYYWIASYTPAGVRNGNFATTTCGDSGELLLVIASSITTLVSPTPITLGGSTADTATVTVTSGGTVGGNVVFNVYASLSDCNSGTNSKFTDTEPVSGSSPQSVTSAAFTPTSPGTYYWLATYGPTGAINGPPAFSTCGDSNEILVVSGIPKITAFGYTNSPTNNDPTLGSGTVTYSFTIHNYGASSVLVSGSLTSTGSTASVTGCTGNGLAFSGVSLAAFGSAGDSASFTVTCSYAGSAGQTVQANLTATFTVPPNATSHPVSGSPATISFAVQTS